MSTISRLDHVIIAVRSLDTAAAMYRRLGFTLTPRGLHDGKGTGNHCIMFDDSYVELLGIVDETGAKGRLAQRVNTRGEGAIAIAYGADDADRTYAALRASGVEAEAPNDVSRPLDLDGRRDLVRFRNVMLPALQLQDTMQFVCTHVTPALTRARREWQAHGNGATGVAEVVVAVDDVDAARSQLAPAELANAAITLAGSSEIERRFGADMLAGAPKRGVIAIVIRVHELHAATALLASANIPHREGRASATVPASATHGVVLELAAVSPKQ